MKKQFSKDRFVVILNTLQKQYDILSDLYENYNIDLIDCNWLLNETHVIKLLEYIFNDEETEWISWWCWETNFGRDEEFGAIFDEDDNIIRVDTAEQLYDFLIGNMEE